MIWLRRRSVALPSLRTGGASCLGVEDNTLKLLGLPGSLSVVSWRKKSFSLFYIVCRASGRPLDAVGTDSG